MHSGIYAREGWNPNHEDENPEAFTFISFHHMKRKTENACTEIAEIFTKTIKMFTSTIQLIKCYQSIHYS